MQRISLVFQQQRQARRVTTYLLPRRWKRFANTGRGWLGVYVGEIQPILAKELGVEVGSGAYIEGVAKGGAAEQFQLQSFDVIQSVDNQPISGHNQFIAVISPKQAGSAVDLTIWRARKIINQRVILSPNPPQRLMLQGRLIV